MTTTPVAEPVRRSRARSLIVSFILLTLGGVGLAVFLRPGVPKLPPGMTEREYETAARRFRDLYGRNAGPMDVMSVAGEIAVRSNRLELAAACFHEIPVSHSKYGVPARFQEAQVLLKLNRADEAEQNFRQFLSAADKAAVSAEHLQVARKWLTYLLSVELRFEDRKRELLRVHADGTQDVYDSKQFFFPNLLIWNSAAGRQRLLEFLEQDPTNHRLRLAQGRYLTVGGNLDEAMALLEELGRLRPDDRECMAALLECHFERNDWDAFTAVANALPDANPEESWLLIRMRGEFALHEKRWKDAVSHFELLRKHDPANPWSLMGLARAMGELNRPDERERLQRQSLVLSRIRVSLSNIKEDNPETALDLSRNCREIGFQAAADAFERHAQRIRESATNRPMMPMDE